MRYPTSCRECRVAKRKCTPDPAGKHLRCFVCKSRRVQCSNTNILQPQLASPFDPSPLRPDPVTTPATPDQPSPSREELDFINLYFRYIHDRPHSLFHENSIWDAIRNASLPEQLWTAMCVMGCRFAPHQSQRDLAPIFADRSRSLLGQHLDQMSLENVQTCVLLANWYTAVQNADLEVMYYGKSPTILRLVSIDDWQESNPHDSFILREIKLRTWWSLVIADNWCPSSLGLPRTLRADFTNDLPMDEPAFQQLNAMDETQNVVRSKGLWAYHASLASIFALIQDINFILVANNVDGSMTDHVDMVAQRLLEWHDSVPETMVMNTSNLDTYRSKGHGGSFIALYFGYHYYSIILYFQFLNPSHQEIDKAATYASRAKHHALAFSRLLHTARSQGDCHVVYLVVAHLTVVSSSVLLHSLLFGDEAEVEESRIQLTLNFEALEELTLYWPCVERMKDRLFVFQNRCLREPAADAYVLDRWTVRFLLEHALPFKETFSDASSD